MNISKREQRVLHVLAQGGAIHFIRQTNGKISAIQCFTRNGHLLTDCTFTTFDRLKKRGLIRSAKGQPYRISLAGLRAVNAQQDNR